MALTPESQIPQRGSSRAVLIATRTISLHGSSHLEFEEDSAEC